MIRLGVVCEGQTEVEFVKTCLLPHLLAHQVEAVPRLLQAPSGRHRGGRVTVERLANFLAHEYPAFHRLTTLVDFYGFQDRAGRDRATLELAILHAVQAQVGKRFNAQAVFPYVQMHEFEGLLFADIAHFNWVHDPLPEADHTALTDIRSAVASPEDINDSPETAPSKRLHRLFGRSYSKTEHGPLIAETIGLESIRQQCPRFHAWVSRLEAWGE